MSSLVGRRGRRDPDPPDPVKKIVGSMAWSLTDLVWSVFKPHEDPPDKKARKVEDDWPRYDGSPKGFSRFRKDWQAHARSYGEGLSLIHI